MTPTIEFSQRQVDKLLWREWSGCYQPQPRFDPQGILTDLHEARKTGLHKTRVCQQTVNVANHIARAWKLHGVRLDPSDLQGSADRSAGLLIDQADQSKTAESAARRAMLLELLVSIEEIAGPTPPGVIHPDPFGPSRLALNAPWDRSQIENRLVTLVLEAGEAVLAPEWPEHTLSDSTSYLWPHAILVEWARRSLRLNHLAARAEQELPAYVKCSVEDSGQLMVKMLARLGYPEFAEFVAGAGLRILGTWRHPVHVELLHPGSEPSWWTLRCREIIHLASCRQVRVTSERWNQTPDEEAIRIWRPGPAWSPGDERALAESDANEELPY